MSLYSLAFFSFFVIIFALYWSFFKKSAQSQNLLLTASSLFFCGWADIRFLALLIFSIIFNFYTANSIYENQGRKRSYLLYVALIANAGLLFYYKYFNFFYESFVQFFGLAGKGNSIGAFNIILPLGISFFTFQAIGYVVDVYNEDIKPCKSLLTFATYITYFPKMTAGPIERAEPFFKQVDKKREFKYSLAIDGLRQILWGAFTKLVIANNCASIAGPIFDNYLHLPASSLLAGSFFYMFQVYCDFSGYSNIAIGISKLFGIELMRNFAAPFFSTNIRDFWKKWHISLSSWMMHYVFTPISFTLRKLGKKGLIISILITFLVIGIWHGANWTFIVFGLLHGLYFIPLILAGNINKSSTGDNNRKLPKPKAVFQMMGLFVLVMLTIVVFGSEDISSAFHYLSRIFSFSIFSKPLFPDQAGISRIIITLLFIILLIIIEWLQKNKDHEMQIDDIQSPVLRIGIYYALFFLIFAFGSIAQINFLYSSF
ncbi:MAG: MBOAT family O-acyltransferase [Bacteroidota bacterium]